MQKGHFLQVLSPSLGPTLKCVATIVMCVREKERENKRQRVRERERKRERERDREEREREWRCCQNNITFVILLLSSSDNFHNTVFVIRSHYVTLEAVVIGYMTYAIEVLQASSPHRDGRKPKGTAVM
jgi:hypothetical protein